MVEQQCHIKTQVSPPPEAISALSNHPMRLLRKGEVLARTGLKNSTMYAYINQCRFPRPVKPGGPGSRSSFWIEAEVEDWIMQGVALRDSACQSA